MYEECQIKTTKEVIADGFQRLNHIKIKGYINPKNRARLRQKTASKPKKT